MKKLWGVPNYQLVHCAGSARIIQVCVTRAHMFMVFVVSVILCKYLYMHVYVLHYLSVYRTQLQLECTHQYMYGCHLIKSSPLGSSSRTHAGLHRCSGNFHTSFAQLQHEAGKSRGSLGSPTWHGYYGARWPVDSLITGFTNQMHHCTLPN